MHIVTDHISPDELAATSAVRLAVAAQHALAAFTRAIGLSVDVVFRIFMSVWAVSLSAIVVMSAGRMEIDRNRCTAQVPGIHTPSMWASDATFAN